MSYSFAQRIAEKNALVKKCSDDFKTVRNVDESKVQEYKKSFSNMANADNLESYLKAKDNTMGRLSEIRNACSSAKVTCVLPNLYADATEMLLGGLEAGLKGEELDDIKDTIEAILKKNEKLLDTKRELNKNVYKNIVKVSVYSFVACLFYAIHVYPIVMFPVIGAILDTVSVAESVFALMQYNKISK